MPTLSAEQAIYERLAGDVSLAAIIGNRIWPDVSRQEPTLPFVIYERVATEYAQNLNGTATLRQSQVAIDIFASTALVQQSIEQLITARLHNWRDTSVGVYGCFVTPGDSQETDYGLTLSLNVACWFAPV